MDETSWQETMYDRDSADRSINSQQFHDLARKEASYLITSLGLSSSTKLLDVPCGTGRHARYFAESGISVTALDINADLLTAAEVNCANLSVNIAKADMRDLSAHHGKYDITVNLFSSFGYFDSDEANEAVLDELVATLKPGGRLVIHLIDRDWLKKVFEPVSWNETDTLFLMEGRRYNPKTHYNEVNTVEINKRSGAAKRYYHKMRLYNSDEIVNLLSRKDLVDIKVVGNFDGATYTKGVSTHPIYIATKIK